ncbi:ABC transporter [Candidatus Poribacteria bacterium]|nr:MAG: ABC transporter [Candidatus Poribacteria bacterium]
MIEVKELTKSYGPTLAVNRVSFDANAGEVVGFIGPNGAGKTTTMRILTCYLTADSGSATVAGYDVLESAIDVRKNVGYLPESAPLYTDMGVVEYLKFMADVRDIPKSTRKDRLKTVVEICGLESVIQKDIGELSKGFRQRVGLAQSLIHDPPILILDEPTSGLDPSQTIEIRNLIKDIGREKLVLFSTHILPEVAATCDRILIISRGQLVANGTLDDLIGQVRSINRLYVAIRGTEETITPQMNQLEGITGFTHVGTNDGVVSYDITLEGDGDDVSELLFQAAVQNGWSLAELRQESIDLEDVFLHFTSGEQSTTTTSPQPSESSDTPVDQE